MAKTKEENAKLKSQKEKTLRHLRKQEKAEGQTEERLLAFLDQIIRSCGYNHKTFAEKAGLTPQSVHWIFSVVDDCTLSKAEELLAAIGLTIRATLEPDKGAKPQAKLEKTTWQNDNVTMVIKGDIDSIAQKGNAYPYPDYIKNYPKEGRLYWLAKLIQDQGYNMTSFSKLIGYEPLSVRYWFNVDNLRISQLRDIARVTSMKIVWEINKMV